MRRVLPEQTRAWLTRAREPWPFKAHPVALSAVTSALALQWILGSADAPQFWLFHAAIALTAVYGGAAATIVATLLSMLLARLSSSVPLSTALLFGLEGLLIGLVVLRLTKVIQDVRRNLDVSKKSIRELESAERHGIRIDRALSCLDQASEDTVLILLDPTGHITDWRTGARRLYGSGDREMVGAGAAALFDEPGRRDFPGLLAQARAATTRRICRQVRMDGTMFEAEIEVSPFVPDGSDGFTMIARDLTHQQARAAADWSTAETHAQLRGEVELAQQQLSTLQELTDPALNVLGAVQFVSELLDRLRTAIHAEGIALVDLDRDTRRWFCASEGLQCQQVHHRPVAAVKLDTARTVMIHNDSAGVAEVSAAVWPADVSSLIAVPVVGAGAITAVMEVVNRTGRRATEWEIALVQVVAARIAGFLEDESYVSTAATAWDLHTPPISRAGSDLRLTLGEPVSDRHRSADRQPG